MPDAGSARPPRRARALEWAAPATDPVLMTARARFLVVIVAARNLALGASLLLLPERFTSNSYAVISSLPWAVWGVGMLVVGVVCVAAAITMDELTARVGVGLSATVSLVWAVGFALATLPGDHPPASPAGVIVWASLTAKDFLIVSYPMASPFEPIINRIAAMGARAVRDQADHPDGLHAHPDGGDEPDAPGGGQ